MILKVIGLMSGTSMDGIDAVLLETDGKHYIKQKGSFSLDYDTEFKLALRVEETKVRQAKSNIADEKVVNKSTELHAKAVQGLLKKFRISAQDVDLIGYHGQALYHNPLAGVTIQIGDGQYLADLTKIKVVNDFRSDDIKNGGQGAPLAPLYHQALAVRDNYFPVVVVNCGGIANISVIDGANENEVMGFDTGPGNVLLDRYIREKTNNQEFIDLDGKYGLKGKINQEVLAKLMLGFNDYLQKPAPKSLDPGD
jgi:anhydro-N-acetylmuramic acid kinase